MKLIFTKTWAFIFNLINIFFKILDAILSIFLFLLCPILVCFLKLAFFRNSAPASKKILFIGSSPPNKIYKVNEKNYSKIIDESRNSQFTLPFFPHTYALYFCGSQKSIYKLTPKVITIVFPKKLKFQLFKRTFKVIRLFYELPILTKLAKKINPSIIYTNIPGNNILISVLLKFITRRPLVAQVMGSYDLSSYNDSLETQEGIKPFLLRNYNKILLSFAFRYCDLVLGFNKYCSDFSIHNGAHPSKVRNVRIIPHLMHGYEVEECFFPISKLFNNSRLKHYMILWSRLSSEKRLRYAIEGALKAMQARKDLGLIICGEGDLKESIEEQLLPVKERVYFAGYTHLTQLVSYIKQADIALIPLGGYALTEAALLKTPIISFDIEWHRELLTDYVSGFIADYPNIDQLYSRIIYILDHPKDAQNIADKAYLQTMQMFNSVQQKFQEVIKEFFPEDTK
ncbi:N-acetyl-alpha-D-glucosaminyl L-malate synthase BshA [Holospora obtusa F1]|uniref:N-acetyl-alpha-D-glucosaminyl L-malate synthase BshA n=1 Tax=Holospora obtusa F1 TaxID=1399147 RepID=W6TEH2_HOLOB|nr:glycosyltransferase family 4 protein [Holospora obtusa]ETZ07149.1 N-acetyl-alpha-D-glucosaminyl L-malate synthase BshA [Holospora obtusa F1]